MTTLNAAMRIAIGNSQHKKIFLAVREHCLCCYVRCNYSILQPDGLQISQEVKVSDHKPGSSERQPFMHVGPI